VSAVSTLLAAAAVALIVGSTPGWPRVRDSFFDLKRGWQVLPGLIGALWINVQIMLISELLIAGLRTLQGQALFPVRFLATAYVDIFRGLPLLLVLYLVGYGLPVATSVAAHSAAPEEMPTSSPSSKAERRAVLSTSTFWSWMISS
jgi:polar amino acid transport system permease protein